MDPDRQAFIFGIFLAVLLTVGLAILTVGMYYLSGLDPRNDFWGSALANIGVLVIPIFGWPAGMVWIYDEYWWNPKSKKRKRR